MSSPVSRRPSATAVMTSPDKAEMLRRDSSNNMLRRDSSNNMLRRDSSSNMIGRESSSNMIGRESSNNNMRLSIDSVDNNNINKTSIPSVNKYDTKINSNVTTINNISTVRTYTGHTYGKSPVRSSYSPTPYSSSSTPKPNAGRYSAENLDTQGPYI